MKWKPRAHLGSFRHDYFRLVEDAWRFSAASRAILDEREGDIVTHLEVLACYDRAVLACELRVRDEFHFC